MKLAEDNWYLGAKYGLYVTWAYEGHNVNPPTDRYADGCGCYPDGSMPQSVNEMADAFDVEAFADDCADMGVEYVTFTGYHAHLYILYPSRVVNRYLPGYPSRRDVVRELLNALHARGIKLQLYIHATVGDTMTDAEREATGWHDARGGYRAWNDFINAFFEELSARYTDMDSYYIDMIFDEPYLERIDWGRIRRSLKAHNPQVVIVGNGEANDTVDYGSREDCHVLIEDVNQRLVQPVQTALCLPEMWWTTVSRDAPSVARYTPEHLYRFLVLTAGANVGGGGLAVAASPYVTRGFEPGAKETLVALGKLIEPVAESIKNTYASTSFITPAGASIPTLTAGVAATRSACEGYEYLHVLRPPRGKKIQLPPALDGKWFTQAVMLPGGQPVELEENAQGLLLRIPGEWNPLDTVIRLTVGGTHLRQSKGCITLPPQNMKATASDALEGHGAHCVIDGNSETFWCSRPAGSHHVVLDLGDTYEVAGVGVLPRQDGFAKEQLSTHICAYSIHVSTDGENFRAVATGEWKRDRQGREKTVCFPGVKARYVKVKAGPDWLLHAPRAVASAAAIRVEAAIH